MTLFMQRRQERHSLFVEYNLWQEGENTQRQQSVKDKLYFDQPQGTCECRADFLQDIFVKKLCHCRKKCALI